MSFKIWEKNSSQLIVALLRNKSKMFSPKIGFVKRFRLRLSIVYRKA